MSRSGQGQVGVVLAAEGVVRILLADEHSLFREAVRVAMESEPAIEVVAEARSGRQAVAEAARARPDVAILDASLQDFDVIRTMIGIRAEAPETRILVVAGEEDQGTLFDVLETGASGYMTKGSPLAELVDAVQALVRGDTLVPPRMLGALLDRLMLRKKEHALAVRRLSQLTRREREVLGHLAEGGNNDTIAQALVISPDTARTHVQNVLSKLGVHSRLEAVAFVRRSGILRDLEAGLNADAS
jgi:DNA-binding NarL/FixJ family response regulator